MKLLNLGAGRMDNDFILDGVKPDVITLDADKSLNPNIVCTLGRDKIKLPDDSIDYVIARHVVEHIGRQGETKEWFFFWEDLYRVMKSGAIIEIISPRWDSVWGWGDPSHTRLVSYESFIFLDQDAYKIKDSAISPFRIRCHFDDTGHRQIAGENFLAVLRVEKPLRVWWEK